MSTLSYDEKLRYAVGAVANAIEDHGIESGHEMVQTQIDALGLAEGMAGTIWQRATSLAAKMSGPTYAGSPRCQSGSIASGGDRAHCSCDVCF